MKVTLASALGTCFGVDDAIEAALDPRFQDGGLTIIGQLVHNPQTMDRLRRHGVTMIDSLSEPIHTKNVMITAHGAPESLKQSAREKGYHVYDASCPLVMRVHVAIRKLVDDGFFPVVFGQEFHVEVRGIVGDLAEYAVLGTLDDLDKLEGKSKVGIVCQTTHQLEYAQTLLAGMRERFPDMEVKFVDTICKPTKDRQNAAKELADMADIMLVIGGYNSSNTKKLKKVYDDKGIPAYHIERAAEIKPEWFQGREHVGITAGTSTPADVIQEVYEFVKQLPEQAV